MNHFPSQQCSQAAPAKARTSVGQCKRLRAIEDRVRRCSAEVSGCCTSTTAGLWSSAFYISLLHPERSTSLPTLQDSCFLPGPSKHHSSLQKVYSSKLQAIQWQAAIPGPVRDVQGEFSTGGTSEMEQVGEMPWNLDPTG